MEEGHFPAEELKKWAEERYSNKADKYAQELKEAHLRAVEEKNVEGLKKLSTVMFVSLSYLRKESPGESQRIDDLYRKLTRWLDQNGGS